MIDPNIIKTFKDAVDNNVHLVETLSKAITKQSTESRKLNEKCIKQEKDIGVMIQAALETKNSSVVSNFSSALSTNLEKMSQLVFERDQLVRKLNEKREESSSMSDQLVSQKTQFLQQIVQLKSEKQLLLDELETKNKIIGEAERNQEQKRFAQQQKSIEEQHQKVDTNKTQLVTQGRQTKNLQKGSISGKFVFICGYLNSRWLFSEKVDYIDLMTKNFDSLDNNISLYKKELLIFTSWKHMNTTSGFSALYANLLSLCQEWKGLRPDGEIHCIFYYYEGECILKPNKELDSLLTTCNKFLFDTVVSKIDAFRQYWPNFVDLILSVYTMPIYYAEDDTE